MELTNQVCSLELAKRLKELGVKQESYFAWHSAVEGFEKLETRYFISHYPAITTYAAFTVAELGEMLQKGMVDSHKTQFGYWIFKYEYVSQDLNPIAETRGDSEADARARMVIYLLENKLIFLV